MCIMPPSNRSLVVLADFATTAGGTIFESFALSRGKRTASGYPSTKNDRQFVSSPERQSEALASAQSSLLPLPTRRPCPKPIIKCSSPTSQMAKERRWQCCTTDPTARGLEVRALGSPYTRLFSAKHLLLLADDMINDQLVGPAQGEELILDGLV
jgi:hypothetical protein